MSIVLTGHTSGLGKYIFENLECDGLSRSNGNNIEDVNRIVNKIKNYDVFINNTFHVEYQQKLFENIFDEWKFKNKTIINILNLSTILEEKFNDNNDYFLSKQKFKDSIQKRLIRNKNKQVRVINLFLGTLEYNENYIGKNKLKCKDVLETIKFVLNSPNDIEHSFISLGCTSEYNNKIL